MNFTLWFIVFLLHSLVVTIFVVRVLFLGVWVLEFMEFVGDIFWH